MLFRCDPERAHHFALAALRAGQAVPGAAGMLSRWYQVRDAALAQTLLGCRFASPVGLAAGFDKNGVAIQGWAALGFGFVEVGTVTALAQAGNPRPRLFRYPAQRSLQNALGFNNQGMEAVGRRIAAWRQGRGGGGAPLGINVGKGRDTAPADAIDDYRRLIGRLGDLADYLVVNISSPNTPGLRDLQNEGFVRQVLEAARTLTRTPVLVKLAPDLGPEGAADLAAAAVAAGAAGIIATNTTIDYAVLPGARDRGGISGRVLRDKSREVTAAVARRLQGKAILMSVGGIDSGAEAYRRLRAGASLVQVYTGMIYEGPSLARRINRELLALLRRDGFAHVGEAIGADL